MKKQGPLITQLVRDIFFTNSESTNLQKMSCFLLKKLQSDKHSFINIFDLNSKILPRFKRKLTIYENNPWILSENMLIKSRNLN